MSSLNQGNTLNIIADFHENNYYGDERLESEDFVRKFAERRGYDAEEALEAAKGLVAEVNDELAQLEVKQLKLIADTIEATGDKKARRGMTVVVEAGHQSVVLIESVRKGKLYGNTVNADVHREQQTYLDGFDLESIVRPVSK